MSVANLFLLFSTNSRISSLIGSFSLIRLILKATGLCIGHASTQTTRIYARPSLEMIRTAMDNSTITVELEEPMWPDNEDELARLFGLR